jgi:hypothetical protein
MLFVTLLCLFASIRAATADVPTCEGNQSNGTTLTTAAGGTFDLLCGIDFFGGDLDSAAGVTFQQCIDRCDGVAACLDVAYVEEGGFCYLKNRLTPALSNPNVWSARKHVTAANISTIDISCDDPGTNGTAYSATTGSTYRILCGLDHYGGDIGSTQTSSFAGCIEACEANDVCIDVSYVNGACYMKETLSSATARSYVWTAQVIKSSRPGAETTTKALSCNDPGVNRTTSTTSNQRVYELLCGIDYLAGDMSSTTTPTFELVSFPVPWEICSGARRLSVTWHHLS